MARLRVRLKFNPGRIGAPMDKLGEFASQAEKFLRSLANDLGVSVKKGEWLAQNFENHSVQFDAEYAGAINDAVLARGIEAMDVITSDNPLNAASRGLVDYTTVAEFSKIGKALDPDEMFYVGIFRTDAEQAPELREIPYKRTAEIRQLLELPVVSHGSIQGVLHSWHFGTKPPFFTLRELVGGVLVRCEYRESLRSKISAAADRHSVLHVYGDIHWERATNAVIKVDADDIEVSKALSEFEFEQIFGSMPEATGGMSTAEFIDWLRGDGE